MQNNENDHIQNNCVDGMLWKVGLSVERKIGLYIYIYIYESDVNFFLNTKVSIHGIS